jgi:hypothetical protein
MAQKIEKFDRYQKLAEACGSVGGVPITGDDVREEMRRVPYNTNIGRDGLLPVMEMTRLKRNVRHAVAQNQVDQLFSQPAQHQATRPLVKSQPSAWVRAQRQDALIDRALMSRQPIVMARGFDDQLQTKQAAWAQYHRGMSSRS